MMNFDFYRSNVPDAERLFPALPDANDFHRLVRVAKGDIGSILNVLENTECELKNKVFEPDDKIAARKWRMHLITILVKSLVTEQGVSLWYQDDMAQA